MKTGAIIGIIIGALFLIIVIPIVLIGLIGISAQGSSVAYVSLNGVITSSPQGGFGSTGGIASDNVMQTIEQIKRNPSIKGVIFEINSPGGSGVASDEIGTAIESLDIPTVSFIREVGASGGYWIASSTDHIIAHPMSIVGSIGVIGSYLDFSEFITEYNVSYQRLVAGENKDLGSPFRKMSTDQESILQGILDDMHTIFIQQVADSRGLTTEKVREYADGSVFLGQTALDIQLIDELGSKQEAISYMEAQLGQEITLIEYTREPTLFDLLSGVLSKTTFAFGQGIGDALKVQTSPTITI